MQCAKVSPSAERVAIAQPRDEPGSPPQRYSFLGHIERIRAEAEMESGLSIVGYVPGAFDMFHIGHLNILRRARERCSTLVVGVVTDEACVSMKGYRPIVPFDERLEIVSAIGLVDVAVADHSADKREAWATHNFDVLFKGSDWIDTSKGYQLEAQLAEVGAEIAYLPYTEHTSSTLLRQTLERLASAL